MDISQSNLPNDVDSELPDKASSSKLGRADAKPFRVGYLLIDGFALMSYAAAVEPFRAANLLAEQKLYDLRFIPASGARAKSSSGAEVRATAQVGEQVDFDLVVVVAGGEPLGFHNARVFHWLRTLAVRGVQLGGVSGGPVILTAAGLMHGRYMTVHWEHASALSEMWPDLLLERTLYTIDRDRITCAGGTAPLDMMHALISLHHGPDFARRVSDWFLHTEIRPSGGPQRSGLVERYGTTSAPIIRTIELMENHLADTLELPQLASLAGLGERQLNRLFREKLGLSTMAFYKGIRLEKAHTLLRGSTLTVTEIALATGFGSSAHFSTAFRAKYDQAPSAWRRAWKQQTAD